jgi:hypothetical protein
MNLYEALRAARRAGNRLTRHTNVSRVHSPEPTQPATPARPKPVILSHKDRLTVGKLGADLYPAFRHSIGDRFREE